MKYWKADRYKFKHEHPTPADGWDAREGAEAYCVEIRKVHTDRFAPFLMENGRWGVKQDVP